MSADLGNTITDEQVDEALKDLDMNGDGVVDYNEFKRWYFSGMKPYRPGRKGLLKAGAAMKKLTSVAQNSEMVLFMRDEANRETTTQKIGFAFNEPDYAETELFARANITGPEYFKWLNISKLSRQEYFGDKVFYQPEKNYEKEGDPLEDPERHWYLKIEFKTNREAYAKVAPLIDSILEAKPSPLDQYDYESGEMKRTIHIEHYCQDDRVVIRVLNVIHVKQMDGNN